MSKESGEFCGIPNSEIQQCAKDLGVTSVNGLQYYAWKDACMKLRRPGTSRLAIQLLNDTILDNPLHPNKEE